MDALTQGEKKRLPNECRTGAYHLFDISKQIIQPLLTQQQSPLLQEPLLLALQPLLTCENGESSSLSQS